MKNSRHFIITGNFEFSINDNTFNKNMGYYLVLLFINDHAVADVVFVTL